MSECVMSEEIGASLDQCEPLDNSFQGGREMFKTHSWRTASLVMALTAVVGLALPALGDDWRPFKGHVDEMLIGAPPVDDDCLKLPGDCCRYGSGDTPGPIHSAVLCGRS